MKKWTVSEVQAWAASKCLPDSVRSILLEEEVTGAVALSLTEADMLQMGLSKLGQRRQLSLALAEEASKGADSEPKPEKPCKSRAATLFGQDASDDDDDEEEETKKEAEKAPSPQPESKPEPAAPQVQRPKLKKKETNLPACEDNADCPLAAIYELCDPFEVQQAPKPTRPHIKKSETGLPRCEDQVDDNTKIYEMLDPFDVQEAPKAVKPHIRKSETGLPRCEDEDDPNMDIYALLDPFEVQEAPKTQKSHVRKSETGLPRCSDAPEGCLESMIYDLVDPFEVQQAPKKEKTHIRKSETGLPRCSNQEDEMSLIFELSDPFDVQAKGEERKEAKRKSIAALRNGVETGLPRCEEHHDEMESMIYSLCDPFEVQEKAIERKSMKQGSRASAAAAQIQEEMSEEDLMYSLLDPNEMMGAASNKPRRVTFDATKMASVEEEKPPRKPTEERDDAEYWQDVTAIKAKQRTKSTIELQFCSRRGIGRNGIDVDEPPELAQARAFQEEREAAERWERVMGKKEEDDAPASSAPASSTPAPAAEAEEQSGSEGEEDTGPFRRTGKSVAIDEAAVTAIKSLPGRKEDEPAPPSPARAAAQADDPWL